MALWKASTRPLVFTHTPPTPSASLSAVARMSAHYATEIIDSIAAAEARGFLFAAPMALELRKGLIPLRKRKSRLPLSARPQPLRFVRGIPGLEQKS